MVDAGEKVEGRRRGQFPRDDDIIFGRTGVRCGGGCTHVRSVIVSLIWGERQHEETKRREEQ